MCSGGGRGGGGEGTNPRVKLVGRDEHFVHRMNVVDTTRQLVSGSLVVASEQGRSSDSHAGWLL